MNTNRQGSTFTLSEGHKKAIVGMYAHGASIPDLAKWYKVSQKEIREILRPHVRLQDGRSS